MRDCENYRQIISVLEGKIKEYLSPDEILGERSEGNIEWVSVRIGESEFTVMHRYTDAVKELMIGHDPADSAIMELLSKIGLKDIANAMTKWGYVPRSVTVSYVIPSKALYLLIEGVRGRVPTIRVSVRKDSYEASASYCVISEGEDICAYLKELIDLVSGMRKCLITYIQQPRL